MWLIDGILTGEPLPARASWIHPLLLMVTLSVLVKGFGCNPKQKAYSFEYQYFMSLFSTCRCVACVAPWGRASHTALPGGRLTLRRGASRALYYPQWPQRRGDYHMFCSNLITKTPRITDLKALDSNSLNKIAHRWTGSNCRRLTPTVHWYLLITIMMSTVTI